MNQSKLNQVLFGLAIVGTGLLFLLHMTGLFGFEPLDIGDFVSQYWPLAPLLVGLSMLLNGALLPGLILTAFAAVMLARNTGYTDLEFGDIIRYLIPVAIILFGLKMIFSRSDRNKRKTPHEEEWTSYNSFPDSVPQAPPLHPDPLKKDGRDNVNEMPYEKYPPQDNSEQQQRYGGRETGDWKEDIKQMKRDLKRDMGNMREDLRDAAKDIRGGRGGRHGHPPHPRRTDGRWWEHQGSNGHHHGKKGRPGRTEWWNTDPNVQTRSNFIGDIHLGHDYWDLVPLNISHFIGDTVLDLTRANIAPGETRITINSFIGDVKVFLPDDPDVGIQVVSSAFIGDSKVLGRKEGGMFSHNDTASPDFRESERRIKLVCSTFIGDVRVTKVG